MLSSSVITSGSCGRLGAGLNQLKLNSSGDGEGEEGAKGAEYTEGEEEGVHNGYCCSVTVSDGSNAGLPTSLRTRGRVEEVDDERMGYEDEVDAMGSELLRWRPLDSKSRSRASRRDILPSSICFLLFGFLSVYLHSSRFDRAQGVQIGFKPSHFWTRI